MNLHQLSLANTRFNKLKSDDPKGPKQAEAKGMVKYIFVCKMIKWVSLVMDYRSLRAHIA